MFQCRNFWCDRLVPKNLLERNQPDAMHPTVPKSTKHDRVKLNKNNNQPKKFGGKRVLTAATKACRQHKNMVQTTSRTPRSGSAKLNFLDQNESKDNNKNDQRNARSFKNPPWQPRQTRLNKTLRFPPFRERNAAINNGSISRGRIENVDELYTAYCQYTLTTRVAY